MSRIRVILLSLLAVLAVGAVASASASAFNLEWQVCREKAGAGSEPPVKYDNHHCNSQKKPVAERKWEWVKLEAAETEKVISVNLVFAHRRHQKNHVYQIH